MAKLPIYVDDIAQSPPADDGQYKADFDGTASGFAVSVQFIKTHGNARLPTKAYHVDNCFDIYAAEGAIVKAGSSAIVPVGLKLAYITPGFGLAIKPRSGLGFKSNIQPHLGEIDNGYRGDLSVKLYNFTPKQRVFITEQGTYTHTEPGDEAFVVNPGDRIAQFKIERVYFTKVSFTNTFNETERGEGGFGSSGV